MTKTPIDYERIATDIFFTGKLDLARHGIQYRKGKTIEDVKHARQKAVRNGHGKTEFEIDMFAVYLKDVFKKAATTEKVTAPV